ncbi:hypothetical protein [Flavobacterium psychrophilum]|uniref:Uncharacterized protein n=1 Tax=Flavobacterium psychrophilum TaxID=96345 RepID=A0A7U2NE90_FLAPS|nr:hypothetical protein [Flavobacterium psychrophilum]QRE03524.1 hypothetical protein H0H26_11630 [Flavobacterium psychrophilum]
MKEKFYYPRFDYEISEDTIIFSSFIRKEIDGIWYIKSINEQFSIEGENENTKPYIQLFMNLCLMSELYFDWSNLTRLEVDSFQGNNVELFEFMNPDILMQETKK